ncbi:MAG: hypothetical protein ABEJ03_04130 [Candidatus Nanohaloarchaea archaeon]
MAGAALVATEAAVALYPNTDFVPYVLPAMQAGVVSIAVLAGVSFVKESDLGDKEKNILMNGFIVAVMAPTLLAAGAFLHSTQTSWTDGEVHYHADYEVLVERDGQLERTDLVNPSEFCKDTSHESTYMCSINDRTGSVKYHEHNDQRIHLEGTFKHREDASLSSFFETFGGRLSNERLVYPTTDGTIDVTENGKNIKILVQKGVGGSRHWCAIGENVSKENKCRSHGRLADSPEDYVISPHTQNPRSGPILDNIFVVYDSRSVETALRDVRDDNKYQGFGLKKGGEGYGG